MLVELDKTDIIRLITGLSPDYDQMDDRYGRYCGGFKDEWKWDWYKLADLSEAQLWEYYQKLIAPRPRQIEPIVEKNNSVILEMQAILEDGIMRGNAGQVQAAQDELKRLEELYK